MVIEILFGMFLGALDALLELADVAIPGIPSWATSAFTFTGQVYGWLLAFDTWIPVNVALTAVGFIMACWGATLLIMLMRMIASFVTLGGGGGGS